MPFLNLGILAHVDAGKTSLTERLLYDAGVLDDLGSVDAGSTRTDSMDLERRRGITIRTAVTSFDVGGLSVNVIDTPGHPDFIAEVERSLTVLDGAVLVLSAVEGVQSQSVVLWRALRRLAVPALVFVNKTDRSGADPDRVIAEFRRRLDPDADVLTGSALTGAGVPDLAQALTTRLPHVDGDPDAPPAGVVFKIDRDDHGRQVWVRMRAGRVAVRDRVAFGGRPAERVTGLRVSAHGGLVAARGAVAGQIAVLTGVKAARIGDTFGPASDAERYRFAPAMTEAVVEPVRPEQRGALFAALTELQDQDPLIALRSDEGADDVVVSLYGEVQKEVIGALLAEDHGVATRFRDTTVVCVERVTGSGTALEQAEANDNPYLATIGLQVEPGDGFRFELAGDRRGTLPAAFVTATEDGVRAALRQGLAGWPVEDCTVTMTHTGYWPRQSHAHQKFNKAFSSVAADFRYLTPVVLMAALRGAGTQVCEPVERFELDLPTDAVGPVLAVVGRAGGLVLATDQRGGEVRVSGTLPLARRRDVVARLADLTRGEGVLTAEPDGHAPVTGAVPRRRRRGLDPLQRTAWFRGHPR